MRWDFVQLGELYEVHNGLSKGRQFFGRGYPFLSFSIVFNNWFLPKMLPDLVQSSDKERESYSILRGDVFITRTSETMDELGMSSVALMDYPNATYNGFTKRLRPIDKKRILPEYIGYYLRCNEFRSKFIAFSTMTTRASLRNEDLLSIKVPVPPLDIQRRIADILSTYDDLIENNRKQIKLLEEAAQRLYKEWFVDLRFPGHEHTRIVDGVPEGWKNGCLSQIAEFKRGKTITKAQIKPGTIPVVAGGLEPAYYHNVANTKAPVITISASGANAGFTRMYHTDVFASDCSFIDKNTCACLPFVYCFLINHKSELDSLQKGSAQPHVYAKDINALQLCLPNSNLLNKFCDFSKRLFLKIGLLEHQSTDLTQARDHLLPKLMSGEMEM